VQYDMISHTRYLGKDGKLLFTFCDRVDPHDIIEAQGERTRCVGSTIRGLPPQASGKISAELDYVSGKLSYLGWER
jgi:hypothetical protein